jgi:hypothetical protein
VNFRVKTKILYKGQEYADPSELPSEVRVAYEKSIASGSTARKIVFNGQEFADDSELPDDVRKICDDVMSVVQNNGHVTLPIEGSKQSPLPKNRIRFIVLLFGLLALIAFLILAKVIG